MNSWSEEQRRTLEELYRRLDARAVATAEGRDWWPCRKGCDHCCRHLADPLPITALEWEVLWEGFLRLPPEIQAEVRAHVEELRRSGARRPYTCPFLDREVGACRVYAHRPMACRSYGFAVSRGQGLWCHFLIEKLQEHGEGEIVWSNQDALEETLARLAGPPVTFFEWFAAHPE
ncbi:MAG: YkgJ family cysteine cluster protein [Myxococcaceae bacterium]|nr:YkgJ family cysteine cluster protein [Myxococcaceae bacterium]